MASPATAVKSRVLEWLEAGLDAVDPVTLTSRAVHGSEATVIAIGKAAAAMCRGAASSVGGLRGVCVTDQEDVVPDGVELLIGDHPIPDTRSLEAGQAVLEAVQQASGRIVALISGGGSALCEQPRDGLDLDFVKAANRALIHGGAGIDETNLVRGHLSAIKCGGLARAAAGPIETYVISDVAGAGPEVVASGPTLPMRFDPERAMEILRRCGMEVSAGQREVMASTPGPAGHSTVEVLANGMTAAAAIASAARADGFEAMVQPDWLTGTAEEAVRHMLKEAGAGVTVAAGETVVEVTGSGQGGRNTHAALVAAREIAGTDLVFAAFATDGNDGTSRSAGGLVDGQTLDVGDDPAPALEQHDSAGFLASAGGLLPQRRTGTNVADIWVAYRP